MAYIDVSTLSDPANVNTAKMPAVLSTISGPMHMRRELGLVASNTSYKYFIPEVIQVRWISHVPLQYLTDKFCGIRNGAASTVLNDLSTHDGQQFSTLLSFTHCRRNNGCFDSHMIDVSVVLQLSPPLIHPSSTCLSLMVSRSCSLPTLLISNFAPILALLPPMAT
jgi:hypothetical protein